MGLIATLLFFGVVLIRISRVSQASLETMGYLLQSDPSAIVLSVAISFVPPALIGVARLLVGMAQGRSLGVRAVVAAFVAVLVGAALSALPASDDVFAVFWTVVAGCLFIWMAWILFLSEGARAGSRPDDDAVRELRSLLALVIVSMVLYIAMPQLVSPRHWYAHEVITTDSATVVGPVLGNDGAFYSVLGDRRQVVLIPIETVTSREVCRPPGTGVTVSALQRVWALVDPPLVAPEYDECPSG